MCKDFFINNNLFNLTGKHHMHLDLLLFSPLIWCESVWCDWQLPEDLLEAPSLFAMSIGTVTFHLRAILSLTGPANTLVSFLFWYRRTSGLWHSLRHILILNTSRIYFTYKQTTVSLILSMLVCLCSVLWTHTQHLADYHVRFIKQDSYHFLCISAFTSI